MYIYEINKIRKIEKKTLTRKNFCEEQKITTIYIFTYIYTYIYISFRERGSLFSLLNFLTRIQSCPLFLPTQIYGKTSLSMLNKLNII